MTQTMQNKFIFFSLYLLLGIFFGCKTTKTLEKPPLKAMPNAFLNEHTSDSTNIAHTYWKDFFADSILISLIDTALKNNSDILTTFQKIEVAQSELKASQGALLPTVSASPTTSLRKFGLYTMDGAGNITTEIIPNKIVPINLPDYYLGLQASWEIDIWGKIRSKRDAALARYLASIEGKNAIVTTLIAEIAISYYELLKLDNGLDIIRNTIQSQENALAISIIQKEAAATNELAVKQFEAQVLNSKIMEQEILQQISTNENKINFLLGRFPQVIYREKSLFSKPLAAQISTGIPTDLLQNRPDIRQAELELVATRADVKAAKAAFYPALNISSGIGFQAFNPSFLFTSPQSIAYSMLGNLTAPLINRSAIKAQFNTAKSFQLEALYNYQKTILAGFMEVRNELVNFDNLQQISTLKSKEVAIQQSSIEIATELFKMGRANYLEVLAAQQNYFQSQISFLEIQRQQFISSISIYRLLGGGWK